VQIFRVIVRGRFADLTDAQRETLRHELADGGDIAAYRFTSAGSLAFDRRLDFFSVRAEVRLDDDATVADASASGEALAIAELERRRLGWRDLTTSVANMADVWR
jgi:hypothetical protein